MELNSESNRYQYFESCIGTFVRAMRDQPGDCRRLAKVFTKIQRDNPQVLLQISDEYGEKYESMLREALKQKIMEYELKTKLEKLTELPDGKGCRPSVNPEADMRAHIALQKYKEITNLQQEIDKVDEELKELNQSICQKEKIVEKRLLHANSMVEDIMAASKIALAERNLLLDK